MILKLAWKQIKNFKSFSLLFILNLSLGLLGLGTLFQARQSFNVYLKDNAKNILGADLQIASRNLFDPKTLNQIESIIGSHLQKMQAVNIYSMVQTNQNESTRLVRLKAIDTGYPYYGSISFSDKTSLLDAYEALKVGPGIWIYEELASQAELNIGDKLKIGTTEFTVQKIITDDSTDSISNVALAPRAYIHIEQLWNTGLIKKGSTLFDHYLYRLDVNHNIDDIIKRLEENISDTSIQFTHPQKASDNVERIFGRTNDYLSLVGLVAFFLACLGLSYLFRSFVLSRAKEIAILRSLGLNGLKTQNIFLIQLSFLSTIATIISFIVMKYITPAIISISLTRISGLVLTSGNLNKINFGIEDLGTLFFMLILSFLVGLLTCLPDLRLLNKIKLSGLLSDHPALSLDSNKKEYLFYVPVLIMLWIISTYLTHSFKIGSLFMLGLILSFVVLGLIGYGAIALLKKTLLRFFVFPYKQSLIYLQRKKAKVQLSILALGFGVLLLNFIVTIEQGLYKELDFNGDSSKGKSVLPSLFVFDIQPEQIDGLYELAKQQGIEIQDMTPLVRARLIKVNGEDFERDIEDEKNKNAFQTREEQSEARMRNRGFNITYPVGKNISGADIVDGKPFSGTFNWDQDKLVEISLEESFAQRINVKIGDTMLFDVQGIEIEGKIINFRQVKWTTFRPNFFVEFQAGSLESAPQTYLATIPQMNIEDRNKLQNLIPKKFPNISVVDISRALQRVLTIINKVKLALEVMIYFAIFSGFIVILSIANNEAQHMIQEFRLMKLLGASNVQLIKFTFGVFITLGLISSLIGGMLGIGMGVLLLNIVFKAEMALSISYFLITIATVLSLCFACSFIAVFAVKRANLKIES